MDNKVILETDRLILRPWEDDDNLDLVEGLNNLNVTKWLAAVPYPYTMDDAISFINYTKTKEKDYNFAIVLKENNKVIGGTQLSEINMNNLTGTGGIWISETDWGHGYGSEAFGARIEYAFNTLGLRRLENGYFKGNERSHKMQLRFGFKDEGIKRKAFISKATGNIEDEYITGLLKEECIK